MLKRITLLLVTSSCVFTHAADRSPTFTEDVLPILREHCHECHRPAGASNGGMVAPMSLLTYAHVRPWARAIAKEVEARRMPPWHAGPEFRGVFANERVLSDAEVGTIVDWVRAGARRGPPVDGPAPGPTPLRGWQIGEPDLILELPLPHFIADDVEDEYVNMTRRLTVAELPRDRWIQAIEFRPDSDAVHHMSVAPLGGVVPGLGPIIYPEGQGQRFEARSAVRFQMHYHKEPGPGTGLWDRSRVGIRFWPDGTVIDYPRATLQLSSTEFEIPAGDAHVTYEVAHTLEAPLRIVGFLPHMHLRGKEATYIARYPDGRSERLLHVPDYDFNWQTLYEYRQPKTIPAGTELAFQAVWDNSADNPYNPDPTATVRHGEKTTDEMMLGSVHYTEVKSRRIVVGEGSAAPPDAPAVDPSLPAKIAISAVQRIGAKLFVRGWAVAPEPIARVTIEVDGIAQGEAVYGMYRPDIGKGLPEYNNRYSGFAQSFDVEHELPARVSVTVDAHGLNGKLGTTARTMPVSSADE